MGGLFEILVILMFLEIPTTLLRQNCDDLKHFDKKYLFFISTITSHPSCKSRGRDVNSTTSLRRKNWLIEIN